LNSCQINSFEEFAEEEIQNLPFVTVYHIDDYEIALMAKDEDIKEETNELE
jgi:hypothetical protein